MSDDFPPVDGLPVFLWQKLYNIFQSTDAFKFIVLYNMVD